MKSRCLALLATSWCLGTPAVGQEPRPSALRFDPSTLELSDGRAVTVERGTLRVPERRGAGSPDSIELGLIRLGSTSAVPGSPIVYLNGDPGGLPASDVLRLAELHPAFERLREAGDVIVMDYRGSGLSRPQLRCPDPGPPDVGMFRTRERMLDGFTRMAEACAAHLRESGVDIRGYTWVEVADDVRDVADALGVDQVRLVGFSSGTHAALVAIRRHPARIERAVLVGTEGLDHTRSCLATWTGRSRRSAVRWRRIQPCATAFRTGGR